MHKNGTNVIFAKNQFDMAVTSEVKDRVDALESDIIFSYRDLNLPADRSEAVKKALYRMVREGIIEKYSKGRFYKAGTPGNGKMELGREEVIKDLLVKDGKRVGYVTGYEIFHKFALTTQKPDFIQIGARVRKTKKQRGIYSIVFLFQRNEITEENIPFLQLLDVIKLIKTIPETNIDRSCVRLQHVLKELDKDDVEPIIGLAKNYPPGTRALTGALIEHVWGTGYTAGLYETLNPISSYSYGISGDVLPEIKKWRIR